jgi:hypothetical protein
MNLKSLCMTKEIVSKLKRPPTEWEKIFTDHISDNRLKPEYTRSSKN